MRDFRFELYLFDEGDERKQTQTLPQFLNSGIRNFCIQNQNPGMLSNPKTDLLRAEIRGTVYGMHRLTLRSKTNVAGLNSLCRLRQTRTKKASCLPRV